MAAPSPHKTGFHLTQLPHFHLPAFGQQRDARPMAAGGAAATAAKLETDFSGRWQKARGRGRHLPLR
jgi:hypothetical protein